MQTVSDENLDKLFEVISASGGDDEIRSEELAGKITLNEFLNFAEAFLSEKDLPEEVDHIIQLMDTVDDFAADSPAPDQLWQCSSRDSAAGLSRNASSHGSAHGDGVVNAAEFKKFFHKYGSLTGHTISDSDLDDIMREIDGDGEGTISRDELLEFLEKCMHHY
jgi:Ca2+-binding EF-hand superfamily protein